MCIYQRLLLFFKLPEWHKSFGWNSILQQVPSFLTAVITVLEMKISNKAAAAVTGLLGHSQCHHDSAVDCQSHSFRRKAILFAGVEWPNSWHNCEIRLILTRSRKTECHQTIPLSPWLYGNLHFMSAL